MCSQGSYARRITLKNISFCKLREEECEVCEVIIHHPCTADNSTNPIPGNPEELATELQVDDVDPVVDFEAEAMKLNDDIKVQE